MKDQVNVPIPSCTNVPADIAETSTIIEEGPRICPLCNSIVKLFFINLNEKIMMCENTECDFPFGHEDVQFITSNSDGTTNEETISMISAASRRDSIASASIMSAAEWSEIDKMNRAYDSEDTQSEVRTYVTRYSDKERASQRAKKQQEEEIKRNVESIKSLNKVIFSDTEDDLISIRSEKWIKRLLAMQNTSGIQLLKQQELSKLKKKEPYIGLGELKIDICNENSTSSIKIEINNNGEKNTKT